MINILDEAAKRDSRDSSKLNTIQIFLKSCYELPSLELVRQRFADISKLQEEAHLSLGQTIYHADSATHIFDYELVEQRIFFLEEVEKCFLSLQQYRKAKTKKFELLRNLVDEFWGDLPFESRKGFEVWAKDLTVRIAEENEGQNTLDLPELLKGVSAQNIATIQETVNRLNRLFADANIDNVNLTKAKLNFIASIFKQSVVGEEEALERVTSEEEPLEFSDNKNMQKLSDEEIHEAGMKAFKELFEDYGDVLEALAKQ